MFYIYEFIFLIFIIFSPIIFLVRIISGKEDPKRFLEKFCFYKNTQNTKKTIWFHGASIGEIKSIIPIIISLEKNKNIKKILLTSSTISSASVIKNHKFKKTTHVFFPIDTNYLTIKFIRYWKPQIALFIDSEIWPNMFKNLNKNKIPIILLNARITEKILDKNTKKKFKNRLIFCAASTHHDEELFIGKMHKELKIKYNNLLTILIPRHTNRSNIIIDELKNIELNTVKRSSSKKINKDTDIYLVDTYGEASMFYELSNITFVGGSIINHGGQNPLEPARLGNYIMHGPNIQNFKEVYKLLKKLNVSTEVNSVSKMQKIIIKKIGYKQTRILNQKLFSIGEKIIKKNIFEINKFI